MNAETQDAPLSKLLEAARIELAAARDKSNQKQISLIGGKLGLVEPDFFQAVFTKRNAISIDEGSIGKLSYQGENRKIEVLSITDDLVTLRIQGPVMADLSNVTIVVDDSWLLEQTVQYLNEQFNSRKTYERDSALMAIGEKESKTVEFERFTPSTELNSNQSEAIEKVLGQSPSFIWGPPGTGKTHTLGHLVSVLINQSERVLLTSNTNVAVDTALLTTFNALKDDPRIREGLIVRFGPIQRADVYSKIGKWVDIDLIVQGKAAPILKEISSIQKRQQDLTTKAEELKDLLSNLGSFKSRFEKIEEFQKKRDSLIEKIRADENYQKKLKTQKSDFESKIASKETMGKFEKLLSAGESVGSLKRMRNKLVGDLAEISSEILKNKEKITGFDRDIRELELGLPEGINKKIQGIRISDIDRQIQDLRKEWVTCQDQIVSKQEAIAKIAATVLRNAKAVFTTAYRTQSTSFDEAGSFQTAIVDEASMLPLPLSWIVAGKASKRFVAAGDFRQIPPIVRSRDLLVDEWYRRDLFEANDIPLAIESGDEVSNLSMLNMQYRMPEPISNLVSKFAYPEKGLISLSKNSGGSTISSNPIVLIDSSASGASVQKIDSSRANPKHVQATVAIIQKLLDSGELEVEGIASKLAAIAPYRVQTHKMIDALSPLIGDETAKKIVATVHRMQGNEKDFVILDLVDAPPENIGLIFKGATLRDQGPRLLNVAISRPRKQMFVIAHLEHLSGRASSAYSYRNTQLSRLINLLEKTSDIRPISEFTE